MFRGKDTTALYEEIVEKDLCPWHMKEIGSIENDSTCKNVLDFRETIKKLLLFIRVRMCTPLLYDNCLKYELSALPSSSDLYQSFIESKNVPLSSFKDFFLLDSVGVFTLCYFRKVLCCIGAYFKSDQSDSSEYNLQNVLTEKLSCGFPALEENFKEFDQNIIKVCYTRFLVIVQYTHSQLALGKALSILDGELHGIGNPEAVEWVAMSEYASQEKDYDESLRVINFAIDLGPINIRTLTFRARSFFNLQKFDEAARDFYILSVLNPLCFETWKNLCESLHEATHYVEAIQVAQTGMKLFKEEVKKQFFQKKMALPPKILSTGMNGELESTDKMDAKDPNSKDVPELIEASDSESEYQDVPDVSDATNLSGCTSKASFSSPVKEENSLTYSPALSVSSSSPTTDNLTKIKKCQEYFVNLLQHAADTGATQILCYVQNVINGKLDSQDFMNRLYTEMKAYHHPRLISFLKKSLPGLRKSLLNGEIIIQGISPPSASEFKVPHDISADITKTASNEHLKEIGGPDALVQFFKSQNSILSTSKEDLIKPALASDIKEDNSSLSSMNVDSQPMTDLKERMSNVSTKTGKFKPSKSFKREKNTNKLLLMDSVKEASLALNEGYNALAIKLYSQVLEQIFNSPETHRLEESDIVSIKYATGSAYIKSGSYDDIQKGISFFKEILQEHKSITFPAAYYGIGNALVKLNRFKDALQYLNLVKNILDKGIYFKVFAWPGTSEIINETKRDYLKNSVEELRLECENPPQPNAFCRHTHCCSQPPIYYTDPDFKGFFSIRCSEHCEMQYHPKCWKCMKSQKHRTEKDFLDKSCFTPDCNGIIIKITNISKEGNVDKEFSSSECKKTESTKQKKSKLEKKHELKEEKKRRRLESISKNHPSDVQENTVSEHASSPDTETRESTPSSKEDKPSSKDDKPSSKDDKPSSKDDKPSSKDDKPSSKDDKQSSKDDKPSSKEDRAEKKIEAKVKSADENKSQKCDHSVPSSTAISADAKPFIMVKKQKLPDEFVEKSHRKRNESKKSKNIISIDEFSNNDSSHCNQYKQRLLDLKHENQTDANYEEDCNELCETRNYTDGLSLNETNYQDSYSHSFSSNSHNGLSALEFCSRENIYTFFQQLLTQKGPLHVDDPYLLSVLSSQSIEVNCMIAEFGGIIGFLKQNTEQKFAIVKDRYLCVPQDVSRAYKMCGWHSTTNDEDQLSMDDACNEKNAFGYTDLNPDAKEYSPSGKFNSRAENVSPEILHRNSPEMVTAISKLRQPLAADDRYLKKLSSSVDKGSGDSPLSSLDSSTSQELNLDYALLRCTEAVKIYFSEEMQRENNRSYIDSCMKPYAIIETPKKKNRCVQTESRKVESFSVGTMKLDDEFDELKDVLYQLNEEKNGLLEQKKLLEDQLNNALDCSTKNQKKLMLEIQNSKKRWEDLEAELDNQKKVSKTKESELENALRLLQEKYQNVQESSAHQRLEKEKLIVSNEKLQSELNETESAVKDLHAENVSLNLSLEVEKLRNEENSAAFEVEKFNILKRADLCVLEVKRTEYLKRIDQKIVEAGQKMKDVQDGLSVVPNLTPVLKSQFEALLTLIREYIRRIYKIRLDLLTLITQQINEVENGKSLANMQTFELNELPEIPSFSNQLNMLNSNTDAQQSTSFAPQTHMMNMAGQSFAGFPLQPTSVRPPSTNITQAMVPNVNASHVQTSGPNQAQIPNIPMFNTLSGVQNALPNTAYGRALVQNIPMQNILPGQTSVHNIPMPNPLQSQESGRNSPMPNTFPGQLSGRNSPMLNTFPGQLSGRNSPMPNTFPGQLSVRNIPMPNTLSNQALVQNTPMPKAALPKLPPGICKTTSLPLESNDESLLKKESKTGVSSTVNSKSIPCTSEASSSGTAVVDARKSARRDSQFSLELDYKIKSEVKDPNTNVTPITDVAPSTYMSLPSVQPSANAQTSTMRGKANTSYEKLLVKLQRKYPDHTSEDLKNFLKEYRNKYGGFSGLPLDEIIKQVSTLIDAKTFSLNVSANSLPKMNQTDANSRLNTKRVLVNKKLATAEQNTEGAAAAAASSQKKIAWGKSEVDSKKWSGNTLEDECIICCVEMTRDNYYQVPCGHAFHFKCIREWLSKKSDCPICRVLILLPEDYPSL